MFPHKHSLDHGQNKDFPYLCIYFIDSDQNGC